MVESVQKEEAVPKPGGKSEFTAPPPAVRRLRIFATDPAAGRSLESAPITTAVAAVPWEPLEPGPCGEYVEVIDHDPASGCFYAPVDLEDRFLLAADGLAPAEGDPKFHQQMTYAVAMRTIRAFEQGLGRRALWSPVMEGQREVKYVGQLRLYPHALRDANAYYNSLKKAILFGYFPARPADPGTINPGGMVFTCLSHDVIAHETSHALLDGLDRGLVSPSNRDMLAFHEAFADIVALFQHFTLSEVLTHELARTRGSLRQGSLLVGLAQEFGQGTGLHGSLRSYIGCETDPELYATTDEPHDRGAILVAAVFDAFVSMYEKRTADLRRLATNGTGILPEGELHPDLIRRFAAEAATTAAHVVRLCIRALDYCPPVDMNFGDFLRALITADCEYYREDTYGYRAAFIEGFRKRGIYPRDVRSMSEDSLRWRGPEPRIMKILHATAAGQKLFARWRVLGDMVRRVSRSAGKVAWPVPDHELLNAWLPAKKPNRPPVSRWGPPPGQYAARETLYWLLYRERVMAHDLLLDACEELGEARTKDLLWELGVYDKTADKPNLEVFALNFAEREDGSGQRRRDVIVWLKRSRGEDEGGCTIVADSDTGEVRYLVTKRLTSQRRLDEAARFRRDGQGMTYFGQTPFAGPGLRLAMVHSASGEREEGYA